MGLRAISSPYISGLATEVAKRTVDAMSQEGIKSTDTSRDRLNAKYPLIEIRSCVSKRALRRLGRRGRSELAKVVEGIIQAKFPGLIITSMSPSSSGKNYIQTIV